LNCVNIAKPKLLNYLTNKEKEESKICIPELIIALTGHDILA